MSSYWSLHHITVSLYRLPLSVYHSNQKPFRSSLLFLSYTDGQMLNPSLISASQPVSTPSQNLSSCDWNANFQIVSSEGLCTELRKIHTNVAPHAYPLFCLYTKTVSHTLKKTCFFLKANLSCYPVNHYIFQLFKDYSKYNTGS